MSHTYQQKRLIERRIEDIHEIKQYFIAAINEEDPTYLLKASTAETGFYSTLNIDLTKLSLVNLADQDNRSIAYYTGIVASHPRFEKLRFLGKVFRGMVITQNDLEKYKKGTKILTKSFSSASKQLYVAVSFLRSNLPMDDLLKTICIYEVRFPGTALYVQSLSEFKDEEEVLILPYTAFKITDIQFHKNKSTHVEITLKECEPW